jgi:hypothetical protein
LNTRFPGLIRTPILAAGQQISQSLGELVQEQRAARTDAATRQALSALKTIEEYFGASVHTLLRLCQVAATANLPPVYQQMADHGRRKERMTMQRAIDDMMNQMGLHDLQFVITGELAAKITSLMWKAHPNNLSQGVPPFSIGETSRDAIMALQEHARIFDLISGGGAAPNLEDTQSLAGLVRAPPPNSLIALHAQNHLFLCFLNVFLGTVHTTTLAWNVRTTQMEGRLLSLQLYAPQTPRHQVLLPALIQRWNQLRWSYWVDQQ